MVRFCSSSIHVEIKHKLAVNSLGFSFAPVAGRTAPRDESCSPSLEDFPKDFTFVPPPPQLDFLEMVGNGVLRWHTRTDAYMHNKLFFFSIHLNIFSFLGDLLPVQMFASQCFLNSRFPSLQSFLGVISAVPLHR